MTPYNKKNTALLLCIISISLLIYFFAAFNERMLTLNDHWTTAGDLDMGYLLMALTGYFIYKNISHRTHQTNLYMLPIVALLSGLLFISDILNIKTVFFVCFILTFPACIATILGIKITQKLLVSWAIVAMAMPYWYILVPFLQALTVYVVSFLSGLLSLTVLIEGNYFTIPSGIVHVAGGCSGLKYFMTSISLALVSSAMNKRSIKFTLLSALCALSLAIIANWIRVFILLIVAYFGGIDQPIMKDHDLLGWVIFAVLMTPWFFIDNNINKKAPASSSSSNPEEEEEEEMNSHSTKTNSAKLAISLLSCLILLSTPMVFLHYTENEKHAIKLVELPNKLSGHPQLNQIQGWEIDYPKATSEAGAEYLVNNEKIDVIVLSYENTNKSVEMANSTNHPFDNQSWQKIQNTNWQSKEVPNIKINITLIKSGNRHKVIYSWYKHGDKFSSTILSSKFNQLLSQFKGIHSSELVLISKDCPNNCQTNLIPNETFLNFILAAHLSI
jgi:exosortase